MKIKSFWIVTKPTGVSTKEDICFQADISELRLQFLGGLEPEQIHGVYTEQREAETAAVWLLSRQGTL